MKLNLYVISILDSANRMQSYGIAASSKANAEAEACRLAGVSPGTETQSSQNLHRIDSVVE